MMDVLLRGLLRTQAALPLSVNRWLGRCLGLINYKLKTRSAAVTEVNLKTCFPDMPSEEITALAQLSMQHTGMTAFETPSVWLSDHKRSAAWITAVENEELLDEAMASDRGTLILLPHLGNWEMFNVYFATKGRMTALYHPPRQDWLKPLMSKIRGDNLVPTNRQGLTTLYKELEAGHVVTVLPDQVPASGEFAPFFSEPALTDRLVPRLIKKTGARALVCIVYRQTKGFTIRFEEPEPGLDDDDLQVALGALNRSVEHSMRDHVSQYQWEYKRFREQPPGYKKLYRFGSKPEYYHQ